MHRRIDQDYRSIWRRLSPRTVRIIVILLASFGLINTFIYLSENSIFYSFTTESTTEETTTTTTTTTTEETTTKGSFLAGCFHEKTPITLADGSIRSLNALTTSDEVLVYSPSSEDFHKSRILTVFHHHRSSVRFLDLYTTNHIEPLRLTPRHSILTKKQSTQQTSFHYDFASNLVVGDWLITSKHQSVQITKIDEILLFNQTISTPLTFEGNIIANNLIASCYATFSHQSMHWISTPIRYWYQIEVLSRLNYLLVHLIDFYSK